jgi:DNA-directed RNA polymerase specialized sigma24 family protein
MDFPETRWSLIGRLAEQPDQVAVVVELYADPIARYLRVKFGSDHSSSRIEDVIQEVLVYLMEHPQIIARARPGDTPAGSASRFRYFIMTLAFNAARNAWRRSEHGKEMNGSLGDGTDATVADALAVAAQPDDELARLMDRAWAESLLALAWRDVRAWAGDGTLETEIPRILELHLIERHNLREVSDILHVPLATCHRRLARGRTYLQKAIIDRLLQAGEIAHEGDGLAACAVLLAALRK